MPVRKSTTKYDDMNMQQEGHIEFQWNETSLIDQPRMRERKMLQWSCGQLRLSRWEPPWIRVYRDTFNANNTRGSFYGKNDGCRKFYEIKTYSISPWYWDNLFAVSD